MVKALLRIGVEGGWEAEDQADLYTAVGDVYDAMHTAWRAGEIRSAMHAGSEIKDITLIFEMVDRQLNRDRSRPVVDVVPNSKGSRFLGFEGEVEPMSKAGEAMRALIVAYADLKKRDAGGEEIRDSLLEVRMQVIRDYMIYADEKALSRITMRRKMRALFAGIDVLLELAQRRLISGISVREGEAPKPSGGPMSGWTSPRRKRRSRE